MTFLLVFIVGAIVRMYLLIAYTKKNLQSDWLRGVQYWPYLYSVFNICTLLLNNNNNKKKLTFDFRSGKINVFIKNKLIVNS